MLIFAGRFILAYGLLITPWPGAKSIYGDYFRTINAAVFIRNSSSRVLQFNPLNDPGHIWPNNFDTSILLANRDWPDAEGNARALQLTVDAWQMGWVPTAFLMALIVATPVSWGRRFWALAWGLAWLHAFILLTMGIFVWNESTRLLLVTLTPFWKGIANWVEALALDPVGPSFLAAAVIWILVTFRRQDPAGRSLAKILVRTSPSDDAPRQNPPAAAEREIFCRPG
jgi:hypothetical protein